MQQVWRKRWRNTAWFALGAITLVLLVSAVSKKNHKACKGIEVTFNGDGNNFFIEEKGVANVLKANGLIIGQPIETINLKTLEAILKNDKWIATAELFFDNNQVLQVMIEEKTPIARIFTTGGSSFYIDSACRRLPLSEKLSARIPMFTDFPSDKAKLSKPDSELLASVKELAMFIQADDFWKAQVAQIDITPEGFEMIPTVGNHVILLGQGDNYQQKFDRLFSFYKQVWTKVGFEKYEKIDVRFDGQVVATIKGTKPAIVDSAKVRTAYEDLFADVKKDSGLYDMPVATGEVDTKANGGLIKKTAISLTDVAPKKISVPTKDTKAVAKQETGNQSVKASVSHKQLVNKKIIKQKKRVQVNTVAVNKQSEPRRAPKAVMRRPVSRIK